MRSAGLFVLVALVSGCVSVQEVPLASDAAEGLRGREATIAVRDLPDFAAFTPGKAALGPFGAAATIDTGNRIIQENQVEDPAVAIAQTLAAELAQRHAVRVASEPVRIASDDVRALAKSHPKTDLLVDVRTIHWSYVYYPTDWARYRVLYTARVRLIDLKRAAVVAEGVCSRVPEEVANAPSEDDLLANEAERLKRELQLGAQMCLEHFRTATLGWEKRELASAEADVEIAFWESVRASNDPADLHAYLEQYPNGKFAALARNRLAAHARKASSPGKLK